MPKNKKRMSSKHNGDDSSSESDYEEENYTLNPKEYNKLLQQLFPSDYMANKTKKTKSKIQNQKSKRKSCSKKAEDLELLFTILPPPKSKKQSKKSKRRSKKDETETEEEDSEEDDEQEEEESEEETEEESESDEEEDSDEEYEDEHDSDEDSEEDESEEDDEEYEEEEEEEDEDEDEEEEEEEEEDDSEKSKQQKSNSNKGKSDLSESEFYEKASVFINNLRNNHKIKNKNVAKEVKKFEKDVLKKKKKDERSKKKKNIKQYMKLVSNKHSINDLKFFKETLSCKEQEQMIESLESISKLANVTKPYRIQLLETKHIPDKFKAIAMKKINAMKVIAEGGGEYHKLKCWVDTFMRIPFGEIRSLPITKQNTKEEIQEYISKSQQILDDAVYGMKDAKVQFMQMIGQWISNPNSIGNAIAIKGPMGTGKTTLIKEGVSKLLNREFAFIALGGATDSSFLEGHSYTYEGSTYGKIVDILIQCKSSNPVIYFDELDKVSETPRGEEIIGVLTHLTDTTQNDKFHDKYFSEIDFDLSKCLFIFSYNDESKVNPILKDRMYNIETKGYGVQEKIVISKNYLIPKLSKELNMDKQSIIIEDDIIRYLVEKFTGEEKGVRNLKRCLEIAYSKLNLYYLMGKGAKLFGDDIVENIEFPYTLKKSIVDKIINKNENDLSHLNMYL
tara:strand:- start:11677 stop:13704 length:2028 start_codon:yes stop_codon:yes gene_type:complete